MMILMGGGKKHLTFLNKKENSHYIDLDALCHKVSMKVLKLIFRDFARLLESIEP